MLNEHLDQSGGFYKESRANKDLLRARQRDMIVGQLTDDQRVLLQGLFPKDRLVQYGKDELLTFISPLDFEKQEGSGYRLLFSMACTAQTPVELTNIFGVIRRLSEIKEPRDTEYRIWKSYHSFLDQKWQKYGTFSDSSKEAQYITEGVSQWGNAQKVDFDETQVGIMANLFFNRINEAEYKKHRLFLAETFLRITLDDSWNPRWRERLLQHANQFEFTCSTISDLPESIFAEDTSYWTSVDGSWVGIDISAQPESKTLPLASELTVDDRKVLERLRQERTIFRQREQDWFNKEGLLESQITNLKQENIQLYQTASEAIAENQQLQKRLEVERQHGVVRVRLGDTTDPFIRGFGYTIDQIQGMSFTQRNKVITFLRKEAGRAFHPDNGFNPDIERMKDINSLLDELSK
ncbi:hypothetical protein HYT02_04505 [Candidatus Gottesmanbacteria bacterium]|nr:hypothetical protein [Candidatus Gottesmanbacteria bacterium]